MPGDRVCSTLPILCAKWRSLEHVLRVKLMPIRSRKKFRCWLFFLNPPQRSSLWRRSRAPARAKSVAFFGKGYDGQRHRGKAIRMAKPRRRTKARKEQRNHPGDCTVETFSRPAPGSFGLSITGICFSKSYGKPLNLDALAREVIRPAPGSGEDSVAWLACVSPRAGYESSSVSASPTKPFQQIPASCET